MRVYNDLLHTKTDHPTILTLGMFDGIHLGHQKLIRSVVNSARDNDCTAGLITFFPHPRKVMGCGVPKYLTSNQEKLDILQQMGLNLVVIQEFSTELAQVRATQFVDFLVENFHMHELWIGHDFALGYQREGDADFLKAIGATRGFTVQSISDPITINGQIVSSSCIRASLQAGDISQANICLGRPFQITGKVIKQYRDKNTSGIHIVHGIIEQEHATPQIGMYSGRVLMKNVKYDTWVKFETKENNNHSTIGFEVSIPDYINLYEGMPLLIEIVGTKESPALNMKNTRTGALVVVDHNS